MPRQRRHRSRSEIICSALEVTNGNKVRRTEIQYKIYLSYNLLTEYTLQLLQAELIEYMEREREFKTTPKGMEVLQMYNRMGQLLLNHTWSTKSIV
jgi:predicted transcriptional regulator